MADKLQERNGEDRLKVRTPVPAFLKKSSS
jgi:hypothetical protein